MTLRSPPELHDCLEEQTPFMRRLLKTQTMRS